MKRIATANRDLDKFGAGKDGFRAAVPGVSDPTYLSADFMNGVQEAIVRVIERAGLGLSDDHNQFSDAIAKILSDGISMLRFPNYAALRAYDGSEKSAYVSGYLGPAAPSGIAGQFVCDDGDTATPDNGGTVIVTASGKRFKRCNANPVNPEWWGALGNDAKDNITEITKSLAFAQALGYRWNLPSGIFRTSGAHALALDTRVVSVTGDGPATSILKAIGDQDVLTITGASQCSVRGIGFDKVDHNSAGRGLVIRNAAYAVVEHVTVYGFGSGFYTEGVLTTLFVKPLARFCGYGMYLDFGTGSNPNAITILSPSLSLNTRWGLRANQPASLLIVGGTVEGNGQGVSSFHGGMYISNAGGEGGVGVTIDGTHFEQNAGDADVHIAATMNPGTVYSIQNCPIFPIDDVHFTANRIYVESSVPQCLKLRGNNFKHMGSYTPNAARKYVAALDTTLLTVDTGGDHTQFYSPVETPNLKAWGPNVTRDSMLSARGTVQNTGAVATLVAGAYNIAGATRIGVGQITCTFVRPMANTAYQVLPALDTGPRSYSFTNKTAAGFTIVTRDQAGNLADSGFDVMVAGGV